MLLSVFMLSNIMIDVEVKACYRAIQNLMQSRCEMVVQGFAAQMTFQEIANCRVLKKFSTNSSHVLFNSNHKLPRYWYALRFESKGDLSIFLLTWG